MLPILALALFALAIIALRFYKKQTNKRVSSISAATDVTGSFHVFLSFRGPDVRNTFLGHLYDAFLREGIRAYIDDKELRKGDEIDCSLKRAIEDSRIAVVLFSKNYASSSWCLDELAKIMEQRREEKIVVKPVFYKVDPREVRTPRDSFKRALAVHEAKLGKDSDKMTEWRTALFEAGSLSGWHLDAKGGEAELVRSLVKDINVLLDRTQLYVAKYPEGIESRVEQIKVMLNLDSDEVCFAGMWGMGGVGKTTLAKATFNAIAHEFDGSVFLPNIREGSAYPSGVGLAKLQEKLLSEVLPRTDMIVPSEDAGIEIIKDRLCRKKVLLLLDDISELKQLNALAGGSNWFGKGSRILVTTRDSSLLTAHDIHRVYHVKLLQPPEASQLFHQHAFSEGNTHSIKGDLIDGCLEYANGLPLALVVLGSLVRNRPKDYWISTLKSLAESPDENIDKILRVSIDGLDRNAREVFLDIACFFKDQCRSDLERILSSYRSQASLEIQKLSERSLITVSSSNNQVEMHDLVELMGRNIVKERDPYQPRRRSRLWDYEDVLEVLSSDSGSEDVTGIVLCLPLPQEMHIDADAFRTMKSLRLLIMDKVQYNGDPIIFPSGLCWISWSYYVASSLQFGRNKERFGKLKHVSLIECNGLTEIPDLSACPNLEVLKVDSCVNLDNVDDSIGCLEKLVDLHFRNCSNLVKLPDKLMCRSLKGMGLWECPKLERLPEFGDKMKSMKTLSLKECGITELDTSVENLVSLERMTLVTCPNLVTIPCSIYKLQNLRSLDIMRCSRLEKFPRHVEASTGHDGVIGFPSLLMLYIARCNLLEFDFLRDANCFPRLEILFLSRNNNPIEIPSLSHLERLSDLHVADCKGLLDITGLPISLKALIAHGCTSLRRIQGLSTSRVSGFSLIDLSRCPELAKQGIDVSVLMLEEFRKTWPEPSVSVDFYFSFDGSEMPDWLQQSHFPDSFTFLVPADVFSNVVGIAVCAVFEVKRYVHCQVDIFVIGGDRQGLDLFLETEMAHLKMKYDTNHVQVSFKFRTSMPGVAKRCGFRLICKAEEDELRALQLQEQNEFWPDEGDSDVEFQGKRFENDEEYCQDSNDEEYSQDSG